MREALSTEGLIVSTLGPGATLTPGCETDEEMPIWHPLPPRWMFVFRALGVIMALGVVLRTFEGQFPFVGAFVAAGFLLVRPETHARTVVNGVVHVLFWVVYAVWSILAIDKILAVCTGQSLFHLLLS